MSHQEIAQPQEINFQFTPGSVKQAMSKAKSSDLWNVPVGHLRVIDGFNPRLQTTAYQEHIRAIADSMKANGYYRDQPLAGYVGKENGENVVIISNGHTRYAAVQLAISEGAAIEYVPVVTKPAGTSMEDLTVALVTSNTGAPLTPYEVAIVCKRLFDYELEEDEIAARLGLSVTQVRNYRLLMSAPWSVHQLVINDKVSATLAIDLLRKHGTEAAAMLQASLSRAEDSGKQRATMKDVVKSTGSQQPRRLPKAQLKAALSYVVERQLDQDEKILNLLAFLTGSEIGAVKDMLTKAASPGQAGDAVPADGADEKSVQDA